MAAKSIRGRLRAVVILGPAMTAPIRVLVVDDHADVRFLIRTLIAEVGPPLEVCGEAADAEGALAAASRLDPDVVVLDALMPGADGFEAAGRILARRPAQRILLFSAIVDDEVRERAARAGITACLSKDDFEALPRTVLELVG
jgi:DNA-binding NarL/FixJ family response regulator